MNYNRLLNDYDRPAALNDQVSHKSSAENALQHLQHY